MCRICMFTSEFIVDNVDVRYNTILHDAVIPVILDYCREDVGQLDEGDSPASRFCWHKDAFKEILFLEQLVIHKERLVSDSDDSDFTIGYIDSMEPYKRRRTK
ncbi:MAG: hypothetical protein ACXW1B_03675 [Nitrososphaeraceae archaeon]